jgi:putative membrane protein PagO
MASLILSGILLATRQKWPVGPQLRAAAWYGFWEFGIGMTLLYYGEKVVPSGVAAVFYAICPVVAIFVASALGMEKLNLRKLAGASLAFAGVGLVFYRELVQGGSTAGLVSIFLAALAAPVAALMLQRAPRQNAVGANAVGALVGLPVAVIASLLLGESWRLPTTRAEVWPIAYLTLSSSVGAFVIFAWLAGQWRVTSMAYTGVIVPIIALVLGSLARHESFAPASLAGSAIVLIGVSVALRSERELKAPAERSASEPLSSPGYPCPD